MSKRQAQDRLAEILDEVRELGNEARSIFQQHFPELVAAGDAYGAFTLGSSWNRYDTTLESLIQETEAFEEDY